MDPRRIRSMGITPEQAMRIAGLTTADIMRMATRSTPYIRFEIDAVLLDQAIADIDEQAEHQALILDFVRHDASREMMADLFDINYRHYTRLRQSLGLPPGAGRPKDCSPEDADRILNLWELHRMARDPRTLLSMAVDVDLPLRTIWMELAQYPDDYQPSGDVTVRPIDVDRIKRSWDRRDMASDPRTLLSIADEVELPLRSVCAVVFDDTDHKSAHAHGSISRRPAIAA